jgi:tetratricopeptide (TPR) repeat protein
MMSIRSSGRIALASALALTLAACGARSDEPKTASSAPAKAGPVEEATALLNAGKEKEARRLLAKTVKKDKVNDSARTLLETIDTDPIVLLGSANFPYVLRPGDTLMTLSERFLGSPLKFYALARYNHLLVPASVSLGQLVRIPGEAPKVKPEVQALPDKPEPVAKPEPKAKAKPKKEAPVVAPAVPQAPANDPAAAGRLRSAGLAALAQGKVDRAVSMLRRAAALDPTNPLIQRDLGRAQRILGTVRNKR